MHYRILQALKIKKKIFFSAMSQLFFKNKQNNSLFYKYIFFRQFCQYMYIIINHDYNSLKWGARYTTTLKKINQNTLLVHTSFIY